MRRLQRQERGGKLDTSSSGVEQRGGAGQSIPAVGVGVDGDERMNQNRLTTAFNRLNIWDGDDDGSDVSRVLHHPPLEIRISVF
jgi:hypothetical protein